MATRWHVSRDCIADSNVWLIEVRWRFFEKLFADHLVVFNLSRAQLQNFSLKKLSRGFNRIARFVSV